MNEQQNSSPSPHSLTDYLWDLWCIVSVIGIWPRFIEPNLLFSTKLTIPIPTLPSSFSNIKIAFFSDLHWNKHLSYSLLIRLQKKIQKWQPHLIVFGGDALSYSSMYEKEQLKIFFSSLKAPFGTFAVLGNHDYVRYTTESGTGEPLIYPKNQTSILWGLKKLFHITPPNGQKRTDPIKVNQELLDLYRECGVEVLQNQCVQVGSESQRINLVGLGDLTSGHFDPLTAFSNWDNRLPGIVLEHNPNSIPALTSKPGDLLLFGHTHGGQVNIPFFLKRLVYLSNPLFKSGLIPLTPLKKAFITRGIGSCYPFRWFAPPEIALFTLTKSTHEFSRIKNFFKSKKQAQDVQWATSRINTPPAP